MRIYPLTLGAALVTYSACAHYIPGDEFAITNTSPLATVVETRGPVSAPKAIKPDPGTRVSGQGFWKFIACHDLTPVPAEAQAKLKGAHGTIIVDKATDIAYWGLQGVGWIGFSNKLHDSWIVAGNSAFAKGNLHGADILPRGHKQSPLIAVADNVSGKIYLTDASFQNVESLKRPTFGPYATNKTFNPTDVAFVDTHELWAVDGYGQQYFLPADVQSMSWRGELYGGKTFSQTPHGITYDKAHGDLLLSARPEGLLKRVGRKNIHLTDVAGLPAGTWLCDVDLWGDYALAACLDGPNKTPGLIIVINLKKHAIVSTIRPKDDLGYEDAQHIHDAAWYVTGKGGNQEVYILFTNWNPGGVGALKLVNIAD